jgi:hypothetical protein
MKNYRELQRENRREEEKGDVLEDGQQMVFHSQVYLRVLYPRMLGVETNLTLSVY